MLSNERRIMFLLVHTCKVALRHAVVVFVHKSALVTVQVPLLHLPLPLTAQTQEASRRLVQLKFKVWKRLSRYFSWISAWFGVLSESIKVISGCEI